MRLYRFFQLLPRGKQIGAIVCLLHLLAIFALLGHHLASRRQKPPRPMIVRTITPFKAEQQAPKIKKEAITAAKSQPAAKPKPTPQPKKEIAAKKIEAAAPPVKNQNALKEIAESLKTLSSEIEKPIRSNLVLPAKIQPKTQFTPPASEESPSYGEFLIAYLQNALDLPEYGDVKATLEIDRFGKLIQCQILEAKSTKNGQFLKNQLPELVFPCLNDFGILDPTQTFTITFRNVEISYTKRDK